MTAPSLRISHRRTQSRKPKEKSILGMVKDFLETRVDLVEFLKDLAVEPASARVRRQVLDRRNHRFQVVGGKMSRAGRFTG
jgi:hypothetical protein